MRYTALKMTGALTVAVLIAVTHVASANETEYLRNRDAEVTTFGIRDSQGRIIRVVEADGSSPVLYFYYDASGCLDRVVHSDGTFDEFDCDTNGKSFPVFFGKPSNGSGE
jgi:hypothetical protein